MSSSNDIGSNELEIKTLEQTDELSTFDCSNADLMGLNEFIHSEALQYQEENLGVTYLFFYNKEIVGFATLVMSQIEAKWGNIQVKIKNYPALLIGRLAVHNIYRDRSIGKNICLWCVSKAKQLSREVGCRLVVVLTQGETVKFYQKCGFEIVPGHEKKPKIWMYLQLPTK
jgi:predicted N-acetyltransferase YhbS